VDPKLPLDDLEAIDQLTRDLYAAISFRPGGAPDLGKLESLFLLPGVLINNNGETPVVRDVAGFTETYRQQIAAGAVYSFMEEELAERTELFGAIAQRFSTYQARFRGEPGEAVIQGINGIQFIRTGGVWRVVSIIWNDETEGRPIPEEYL
jgi:hypothetical protein